MRIGVLTNLRAGRGGDSVQRVRAVLDGQPDVLVEETREGHSLRDVLAEFERREVELLVLNGGDGTLQRALTRLLGGGRAWSPLVAPLRGGRTNTSALTLGCQPDPAKALAAILAARRDGGLDALTHTRPVVRCDLGSAGVQYGMFFGAGILYNAIRATHDNFPDGRAQGWLGASVTTTTLIGRALLGRWGGVLSPEKIQVSLEGQPVQPQEFLILMATTLDRLFLRMRPWWGTEEAPLRFSTIAARPRGLGNVVRVLAGRGPGRRETDEGYISHNVHEAALRLDGGSTIDGELFDPEPDRVVRLSAERRVRFVCA